MPPIFCTRWLRDERKLDLSRRSAVMASEKELLKKFHLLAAPRKSCGKTRGPLFASLDTRLLDAVVSPNTAAIPLTAPSRGDTHWRWRTPNMHLLSPRFSTALDSHKTPEGIREQSWDDVRRVVRSLWSQCEAAWQSVRQAPIQTASSSPIMPDEVLFLIIHSATQHAIGSGKSLLTIARETQRIIHAKENSPLFRHILRVLVISVGVHQFPVTFDSTSQPHSDGRNSAAVDVHHFFNGGPYTLQAILRGLTSTSTRGTSCSSLSSKTMVLSDGWLHPRGVVSASVAAASRASVEVVPMIVSASLTPDEMTGCARYIASRCVRRRSQWNIVQ